MGRWNCNRCGSKIKNQIVWFMERYKCVVCGYIYDKNEGDQSGGIEPGISFPDLPGDYTCPVCGAGKEEFIIYE